MRLVNIVVAAEFVGAGDHIMVPHSSESIHRPGACVGTIISADRIDSGEICVCYRYQHGGAEYRTNSVWLAPDAPVDTLTIRVSD